MFYKNMFMNSLQFIQNWQELRVKHDVCPSKGKQLVVNLNDNQW